MSLPTYLFEATDAQLAMELAAQLYPIEEIIERYGLTKKELKIKLQNDAFKAMCKEAKTYWGSAANTKERIRMKSQMMLEDSLILLYQMANAADGNVTHRLEAIEKIAVLSDAKPKRDATAESSGGGFHLTLNLPGKTLEVNAPCLPAAIDGEVVDIEHG